MIPPFLAQTSLEASSHSGLNELIRKLVDTTRHARRNGAMHYHTWTSESRDETFIAEDIVKAAAAALESFLRFRLRRASDPELPPGIVGLSEEQVTKLAQSSGVLVLAAIFREQENRNLLIQKHAKGPFQKLVIERVLNPWLDALQETWSRIRNVQKRARRVVDGSTGWQQVGDALRLQWRRRPCA